MTPSRLPTPIERPASVQINAWSGGDLPNTDPLPARTPWAQVRLHDRLPVPWLAPPVLVDERRWDHPEIGWGLLLPENETLSPAERATATDAPAAIQALLAARRGSPVLRWMPQLGHTHVRRYGADGKPRDLEVAAPRPGAGEDRIPRYLLIYAPPAIIPWSLQYALNLSTYVGRLDLDGPALDHYIEALLTDWSASACQVRAPVVWSVDHGAPDISWLMARAIADRLWQSMEADPDLGQRVRLKDTHATHTRLVETLAERQPGLVVTTSHGMTGPLRSNADLTAQLGLPVDVNHALLRVDALQQWQPSGAIWYAHACCAAGSDAVSRYAGLLAHDANISQIVSGVANAAGAMVAPLPRALLGASSPLRAFVGHVEPTFDWTMRDPVTNQVLIHILCDALYTQLLQPDRRTPIGFALRKHFKEAGAFFGSQNEAIGQVDQNVPGMRDWALYRRLVALDRQTLVILGDPTVSLPLLH
jgi:hypothetical protein